jgi:FKBP-type peptidyl-prolyl cis-trans isomerase
MENGLYFNTLQEVAGKPVEVGDIVTVNYEGRFLNGKFFDSTIKRNQPFEFIYGTEMQVIHGLEDAIGRMREGEKALVILPSELAWGEKGSSTGIIPPFTSVIYEVELIKAVARE